MKLSAELPIIGMDIAKNAFQLHIVDPETGEIECKKLKRDRVAPFFANRPRSVVAFEACGGAHYWGRTLAAQGHQVKLLPANQVRAFVVPRRRDRAIAGSDGSRNRRAATMAATQKHVWRTHEDQVAQAHSSAQRCFVFGELADGQSGGFGFTQVHYLQRGIVCAIGPRELRADRLVWPVWPRNVPAQASTELGLREAWREDEPAKDNPSSVICMTHKVVKIPRPVPLPYARSSL